MAGAAQDRNEMLLEAGLALSSELSLQAVLQRIVELAVRVTGARYGALGVLGPEGRISQFITVGVTQKQREAIGHIPMGKGILGVLIDEGPLRLREISDDPRSVGFPPNHPAMHSFLGAPVKARGRVFGNIYLTEKRGAAEFSADDERALVSLAAQAGVAVENAQLMADADQRARRLEAVREISARLMEGAEPETLLELIATRAREMVRADIANITVPADDGESLVVRVAVGFGAERIREMLFPRQESISGQVIETGRPVVLENAATDHRTYQPVVALGDMGPAMLVPLVSQGGRPFGTLLVANRSDGRLFAEEDLSLVETFAGQASVALEYARVQDELKRLAVMEDRERIARELHDGVIQSLFAVGMGLQATASLSGDPDIDHRIGGAIEEVDRVIRDLRNYIFGLRPGILADRQLDQALHQIAEEFEGRAGVTTVVDVDPNVAAELSGMAQDILQVAREALSNVGRHAVATTCRITLRRRDGSALLEVDDDGQGFDVATGGGAGQGLRNLSGRARSLGGELEIHSVPGEGTTLRVRIPL